MFPKIERRYVKSDPVGFRAKHYWTEASKELKHLRKPHEHKFVVHLAITALGENRELACEDVTDMLLAAIETIPEYFPWSCETLGRKILGRIIRFTAKMDEEMYETLLKREFIIEIKEGVSDQGVVLTGRFTE